MPRDIESPLHGYTETVFTLDDAIDHLMALRRIHGGDVVMACDKGSSNTAHLIDDIGRFSSAEVWEPEHQHRGPAVVLRIND